MEELIRTNGWDEIRTLWKRSIRPLGREPKVCERCEDLSHWEGKPREREKQEKIRECSQFQNQPNQQQISSP